MLNCGIETNEDVTATIRALRLLGIGIDFASSSNGTYRILAGPINDSKLELNAEGSGTTARFLIPYSSLTPPGSVVKILGNESLSRRPMDTIFEPLSSLGVRLRSVAENGRLPVEVEGGGIVGGECEIDGSVSSQFLSGLLISCVKARKDSIVSIKNPGMQVSTPYIAATLQVLRTFGFKIYDSRAKSSDYTSFKIPGNQLINGKRFAVPGDMSSAAALIGASIAAGGRIRLTNNGATMFLQPDAAILELSKNFGARVQNRRKVISVSPLRSSLRKRIRLDLKNSPDLVPAIAGLAAATETPVLITNIEHLRFKESDRIAVLARELSKIGVKTRETESSLHVLPDHLDQEIIDNTLICPEGDHRMLMALTIAGLSGHFGTIYIEDPDCVRKSYPSFVNDLQRLCHDSSTLKIVSKFEGAKKI